MFKNAKLLIFLVLVSVNICGCAPLLIAGGAIAGGTGTWAWITGKLVHEVDAPLDKTVQAAKYTLESLNLDIIKEVKKVNVAQIKGRYTDKKTIWIDIHKISQYSCQVAVRVGAIADREATYKILDRIKQYLQEPAK